MEFFYRNLCNEDEEVRLEVTTSSAKRLRKMLQPNLTVHTLLESKRLHTLTACDNEQFDACQKVTSLSFGVGVSKASLPSRKDFASPVESVRARAGVPQQLQNSDEINSVYFDPTRWSFNSSE